MRTARDATSLLLTASRWVTRSVSSATADIKPGNCLPLREHPGGHRDPLCGALPRQGRAARAQRRQLGAAHGQGGQIRPGPHCPRARFAWCVWSVRRLSARSATSTTRTCRSARPDATRHMGIRPTVRGSVMNPCDHPHGGGEGQLPDRTSGSRHALGQARAGLQDPLPRRTRATSSSSSAETASKRRSKGGRNPMSRSVKKGPLRTSP